MADPTFDVLVGAEVETPLGVEAVYRGRLRFPVRPRPYIVANFVSTIDGVVSLGVSDGTDSSTVGAGSEADRYVMAMLRAAAGAVVIGAGTLRATPGHQWIPAAVAGDRAELFEAYRAELHGSWEPAPLVVVTAGGDLPPHVALDHPATRTFVFTTPAGAPKVRAAHPLVEAVELHGEGALGVRAIVDALSAVSGAGVILTEGGPQLLGRLIAARAVHELFLTVSPRIAGRDHDHPRPGLVEGWSAGPDALRAATLESARRSRDHLFLRYRLEP